MAMSEQEKIVISEKVKSQILAVRDTGRTNMFDVLMVQRIAYNMSFYDLVVFLDNKANHKAYVNFILYGDDLD